METNQNPQKISFLESFLPNLDDRERVTREAAQIIVDISQIRGPMTLADVMRYIMRQNVWDETKLYLTYTLSRNAGIEHTTNRAQEMHNLKYVPLVTYAERDQINPIINAN